jgi:hypothetical protein
VTTLIGAEVKRHIEHTEHINDLADFKMAAHEQLNGQQELVKDYDPKDRADAFKQGADDWFENYSQNLKDQEVKAAAKTHWATWYPAKLQQVGAEAQKQRIINAAGKVEEFIKNSIELYLQEPDDVKKASIKGDAFGVLNGQVASGLLHPAQAEKLKHGWDKAVSLGQLNADLRQNAPAVAAAIKQAGAYGMTETELAAVTPHVHAEVARVQGENALEMQKLYEQKQLTPESLRAMRDGKIINLGTWKHYDASLINDAAPYGTELNYDTWAKHHDAAMNGMLKPEDAYAALKAGQYGKGPGASAKADQLIRLNESRAKGEAPPKELAFTKDPALRPYFNLATKEIEDRLKPL